MHEKKGSAAFLQQYQSLIGRLILAAAIIIAACIIANAVVQTGAYLHSALGYLGELVRDGLVQAAP